MERHVALTSCLAAPTPSGLTPVAGSNPLGATNTAATSLPALGGSYMHLRAGGDLPQLHLLPNVLLPSLRGQMLADQRAGRRG